MMDPHLKLTLIKSSFYFTYVMLFTTGTITLVEALRTKSIYVRHVMNLETAISIVAAFFYSVFVDKLKQINHLENLDYQELTHIRYNDWAITTPLMLLVLSLVLANENKKSVHIAFYVGILLLDMLMLLFGYLGEIGKMDHRMASILGFVCFFLLFAAVGARFMDRKSPAIAWVTWLIFIIVWFLYGIAYYLPEEKKTIVYNVLDVIAKCLVGLFFWAYFGKVLQA